MDRPDVDRVFHALGDPTRRRIFERISERPISVSRLAEPFGITLTAVGQHLQVLEGAGLVRSEKSGRVRSCSIEPSGLAALREWVDERRSAWDKRLDRLEDLLEEDTEAVQIAN